MYKVVIVVDNPRDREEAAGLPDWSSLGLQVAGVFSNGLEALQEAERIGPDIVLIDVHLPAMDAHVLGRRMRERIPGVQLIFVGRSADFDSAKSAMRPDERDELWSPIRIPELKTAIENAAGNVARERAVLQERDRHLQSIKDSLPLQRERFMRGLLQGDYRDCFKETLGKRMELLEINPPEYGDYRVILVQSAAGQARETEVPASFLVMDRLERSLTPRAERHELFIGIVSLSDQRHALIVGAERGALSLDMPVLDGVLKAVYDTELSLARLLSVGVSSEGTFAELPELYGQTKRLLEENPYSDRTPRIVLHEEIGEERHWREGALTASDKMLFDIRDMIYSGKTPDALLLIERYLSGRASPWTDREVREFMVLLSATLQRLYVEAGISVNGLLLFFLSLWNKLQSDTGREDIVGPIDSLIVLARNQLLEEQRAFYDQVVKDMKRTIMKRYTESITIRDITDGVHLSFAHANYIFKYKTGRKLFDYLTDYRMEKAKSLLRDGGSEPTAVAQQAGYASLSHFRLSFLKATGLTPAEYGNQPS
ncbi:MAG: two component transcriptional regulator, AraC family [Paenibacillus sp.]|nr:two component transcriptional regulator, AraC family [Paenibacillus sp.]